MKRNPTPTPALSQLAVLKTRTLAIVLISELETRLSLFRWSLRKRTGG